MLVSQSSLEVLHRFCSSNRRLLERSESAGCICCGASFAPSEIRTWVQRAERADERAQDETAACPRCGVDAVLPSAAPVLLTPRMLAAMQAYWFGSARTW